MVCGSADGTFFGPFIIVPGVDGPVHPRRKIATNAIYGSRFYQTTSGWMTGEAFVFFVMEFDRYLTRKNIERPVLLIVDGWKAHLNHKAVRFCKEHDIELYLLLPNATQVAQPMDRSVMEPLKAHWGNVLEEHQRKHNWSAFVSIKNLIKNYEKNFLHFPQSVPVVIPVVVLHRSCSCFAQTNKYAPQQTFS